MKKRKYIIKSLRSEIYLIGKMCYLLERIDFYTYTEDFGLIEEDINTMFEIINHYQFGECYNVYKILKEKFFKLVTLHKGEYNS